MLFASFPDLVTASFEEHLKGKASHSRCVYLAAPWIATLTAAPTRTELLARHQLKGQGHFQPGATHANNELALLRTICRWGMYHERWAGGDPTAGIKKWKRKRRKTCADQDQISKLLTHFLGAASAEAIRDRALFGMMLFTGCRPSEARTTRLDAITPYRGGMGRWDKGKTKNGDEQVLPLPTQLMPWIAEWKTIRSESVQVSKTGLFKKNSYLFPGHAFDEPVSMDMVGNRWERICLMARITGLWNYDLRRTLVCHMGNELNYSEQKIKAIINHKDGSAFGHYSFMTFDALVGPIQHYADWLWGLHQASESEVVPHGNGVDHQPPPMPIAYRPRSIEREEWPG